MEVEDREILKEIMVVEVIVSEDEIMRTEENVNPT